MTKKKKKKHITICNMNKWFFLIKTHMHHKMESSQQQIAEEKPIEGVYKLYNIFNNNMKPDIDNLCMSSKHYVHTHMAAQAELTYFALQ